RRRRTRRPPWRLRGRAPARRRARRTASPRRTSNPTLRPPRRTTPGPRLPRQEGNRTPEGNVTGATRVHVVFDRELLSGLELFEGLDDATLDRLMAAGWERNLVRGDVLFEEGAEADALYVVGSGRIAISNKNFDGRESMVALMERGDLFGEMSLFDG